MYPKEEVRTEIIDNSETELSNIWVRRRKGDAYAQYGSYANDVWSVDSNKKDFLGIIVNAINDSIEIICLASFIIGCQEIEDALAQLKD